jgi:ribosomal protein S18 acetylase RimI-like enzyme
MKSVAGPSKDLKTVSIPEYEARLAALNSLGTTQFRDKFLEPNKFLSFSVPEKRADDKEPTRPEIDLEFFNVEDLPNEDFERCFALLRATSKEHYANSTRGWKENVKRDEMDEDHMRFIIVKRRTATGCKSSLSSSRLKTASEDGPELRNFGFVSFKIDEDDTKDPLVRVPVVYVYEIHLGAGLRGMGIGGHLMKMVEHISRESKMDKVILSVFTVNRNAEKFYRGLGYVTDETSPSPKTMRSRTVQPEWLYLSLPTKEE